MASKKKSDKWCQTLKNIEIQPKMIWSKGESYV